jgi:hypothetical protein
MTNCPTDYKNNACNRGLHWKLPLWDKGCSRNKCTGGSGGTFQNLQPPIFKKNVLPPWHIKFFNLIPQWPIK